MGRLSLMIGLTWERHIYMSDIKLANSVECGSVRVCASWRATLRAKYLGDSGRISVARFENSFNVGMDPQRVMVKWDHALDINENYVQAFSVYLSRAGWVGDWVSSTITDGAVCVCISATDYGSQLVRGK